MDYIEEGETYEGEFLFNLPKKFVFYPKLIKEGHIDIGIGGPRVDGIFMIFAEERKQEAIEKHKLLTGIHHINKMRYVGMEGQHREAILGFEKAGIELSDIVENKRRFWITEGNIIVGATNEFKEFIKALVHLMLYLRSQKVGLDDLLIYKKKVDVSSEKNNDEDDVNEEDISYINKTFLYNGHLRQPEVLVCPGYWKGDANDIIEKVNFLIRLLIDILKKQNLKMKDTPKDFQEFLNFLTKLNDSSASSEIDCLLEHPLFQDD